MGGYVLGSPGGYGRLGTPGGSGGRPASRRGAGAARTWERMNKGGGAKTMTLPGRTSGQLWGGRPSTSGAGARGGGGGALRGSGRLPARPWTSSAAERGPKSKRQNKEGELPAAAAALSDQLMLASVERDMQMVAELIAKCNELKKESTVKERRLKALSAEYDDLIAQKKEQDDTDPGNTANTQRMADLQEEERAILMKVGHSEHDGRTYQAIIDRLQETLIHSAKGASGSESLEREISIVAKEKELAMRMQKDAHEVRSEVARQMKDLANQQSLQQKQLHNLRCAAEAAEKLDERRKQRFSQRQELARKVREGRGRVLISLKSKDSQTHWRRALLERKKMDQRDEEKGFMDQIRKIEDKVGVQTPQELCELVLEQGGRTEELAHARAECEAERDDLEEKLRQYEDDLAGLRGWKPGERLTKELEKFDAPMEAARAKLARAAAALRQVDHLVAMTRVCFQGLCQKLEVHVPGLVRPSRPGSGRLRAVGLTRPKSCEDLSALGGDGVEDEEAEAQRAQKAQQLEEELNSLPAQLEAQMLKLQAAVSNNETIAAPSSSLARGGAQQQAGGGGGGGETAHGELCPEQQHLDEQEPAPGEHGQKIQLFRGGGRGGGPGRFREGAHEHEEDVRPRVQVRGQGPDAPRQERGGGLPPHLEEECMIHRELRQACQLQLQLLEILFLDLFFEHESVEAHGVPGERKVVVELHGAPARLLGEVLDLQARSPGRREEHVQGGLVPHGSGDEGLGRRARGVASM